MSESNIMMVNPNEIVIDMPVDEQNVTQKMESMKERGIIQPVTLWLQGMRVIDGFHRSVAAQRLGWNEIPCYVVDCSEDAFWDARIQSARQHHRIERERLNVWILEAWKNTHWYKPDTVDSNLAEHHNLSLEHLSLIDVLWTTYRKQSKAVLSTLQIDKMRQLNADLFDWLADKARKWGIPETSIVSVILEASRLYKMNTSHNAELADRYAEKYDLSLSQRQTVASNLGVYDVPKKHNSGFDIEEVDEWVAEVVVNTKQDQAIPLNKFAENKRYVKQKELESARIAQSERQQQYFQTPQGQAEAHKRKVQTVKEAMDRVVWTAESVEHLISDNQDFSAPIAEAIAVLTDFHREHFKRKDTKIKDLVIARNAQLRREVKALTEKVESLERALNTKQAVTPRLKNVMVEHAQ